MIQRVQTLYLLLTTMLVGILLFTPLATFCTLEAVSELSAWVNLSTDAAGTTTITPHLWFGILLTITALLPFATLLLYRARKLQMKLCLVELLLILASIGAFAFLYLQQSTSEADATPTPQVILLLVAILPVLTARRRIAKDEALVKSLDRIR